MSTSTEIMAKHTFDRSSHQAFVKDISNRFQCNVYLIFESYIDMDDIADNFEKYNVQFDQENKKNKWYLIDKYILADDLPHLIIEAEDYMYNWLVAKLGDKAGEYPGVMEKWSDNVSQNNSIFQEFASDTKLYYIYFNNFVLQIAHESVRFLSQYIYMSWWDLLRMLLPSEYNETILKYYLAHRPEINKVAKICGADRVYYYSEINSNLMISQGDSWSMEWKEIYNHFDQKIIRDHQILLSKYSKDYNYFSNLITYYKNNIDELPLLVVDDFQEVLGADILNFIAEFQKPFKNKIELI